MIQRIDGTIEKKETQPRKESSPDSIGLTDEAILKSPKDVLALGQMIVRQLDLKERGHVLERWLAHHLAEVMAETDEAIGPAKAEAEARAVDLVLKLWTHRRALPEPIDPLDGYRKAINVLGRLMPEANPWRHFHRSDNDEDLLFDMFGVLSRTVVAGLLLTQVSHVRRITAEEFRRLEEEEVRLHSMFEDWKSVLHPEPRPAFRFNIIDPNAVSEGGLADVPANSTDSKDEAQDPNGQDAGDDVHFRSAIVADLERMQTALAALLDRWKNTMPSDPEIGAEDESTK